MGQPEMQTPPEPPAAVDIPGTEPEINSAGDDDRPLCLPPPAPPRALGGEATRQAAELPHMGQRPPQVLVPKGSAPKAVPSPPDPPPEEAESEKPTAAKKRGRRPKERQDRPPSDPPIAGLPSWAKTAPLIPADPHLRIRHAPNLSTPDRPTVPPDQRAPRSSADLINWS